MKSKACYLILAGLGVVVLLAAWPQPTRAVPSFSRKYETSCQTCHIAFPELNAFGECYMRNGFRYPGGLDREMQKTPDITLGETVENQLFPKSVWAGSLPAQVPLSADIQGTYTYMPQNKDQGTNDDHSLDEFGGNINLFLAGTLGPRISYWGEANLQDGQPAGIDRAFVQFNFFNSPWLNLRAGKFETDLMEYSAHRSLLPEAWLWMRTIGDNMWMPPLQQGVELSGNNGRIGYNLGLVEGAGNAHNRDKDWYGRVECKFGGLNLDGSAGDAAVPPETWRDNSLTIAASYYAGFATLNDSTGTFRDQQDLFYRASGDFLLNVSDVRIFGGYFQQHDNRPLLAKRHKHIMSQSYFAGAEWSMFPWLIPAVRFEQYNSGLLKEPENRITSSITILVRPNVRLRVMGDFQGMQRKPLKTQSVSADFAVGF